jgi:signal transduction histidine kinase
MGDDGGRGVEAIPRDLERGSERIRMAVVLTGAVLATFILGTEFVYRGTNAGFMSDAVLAWTSAITVFCWLALASARRPISTLWIVCVAFGSMTAAVLRALDGDAPAVEPVVMVVMLWTGMLVELHWQALVGTYALLVPIALGGSYALYLDASVPAVFAFSTMAAAVVVPIGFTALMSLRNRSVERRLRAALAKLEDRRRALEDDLRRHAAELKASQDQLVQAQKLETVGTMAAGLAHELNNLLTPVRGFAERLAAGVSASEARKYGRRMLDSTESATSIAGALLTYTRQGRFDPVYTETRELLESQILPVLSRSLPAGVSMRVELERGVHVEVDRMLFQQCVTNLVFNAVAAMPDGGDITVTLATRPWEADPSVTPDPDDFGPTSGLGCELTVADTGSGIDPAHLDRIFDPFFTTKGVGSGTGLGLAIVQGIVARHGGHVKVETAVGEGSAFTLVLPVSAKTQPDAAVVADHSRAVVVVAADQDMLDEFEELLASRGFAPICGLHTGDLEKMLAARQAPKLVVLDLDHLDPTPELGSFIRRHLPGTPVLLLSGRAAEPPVVDAIGAPLAVLHKPVDSDLLLRAADNLLAGRVRLHTPRQGSRPRIARKETAPS